MKSYGFQTWPVHSEGPSEQMPIKICVEKEAWAYPGTAQFFRVPPIIPGTGKATNFTFCMHIYRLNRNKSPLKISAKSSRGRGQGLPKIFRTPTPIHTAHRAVIFAIAQLSCRICNVFTARCTLVQSAVLRSHVVRPSVRPSVCDVGGSGSHRLEILETNCTVT